MTHQILDEQAVRLSQTYRKSEVELISVLISMKERNSFLALRYKDLWEYCTKRLELSESQTGYLRRIIDKSVTVPGLAKAIQKGEISISQARRIVPVVSNANLEAWVEKANTLPQKELERQVAIQNPRSAVRESIKPITEERSKLTVGISKAFEADLNRLCQLMGKSKEEVLAQACKKLLSQVDPEQKAQRCFLRKSKPANVKAPKAGERTPIPAATKHEFIRRHGYHCAECKTNRYLNWHHKKPVSRGGNNDIENLELLCWPHHRIHHAREKYIDFRAAKALSGAKCALVFQTPQEQVRQLLQ